VVSLSVTQSARSEVVEFLRDWRVVNVILWHNVLPAVVFFRFLV